jgi:hypothetical protein
MGYCAAAAQVQDRAAPKTAANEPRLRQLTGHTTMDAFSRGSGSDGRKRVCGQSGL